MEFRRRFRRGDRVRINKDAPRYPNTIGEIVLIYTSSNDIKVAVVYFKELGEPWSLARNAFYFKFSDITLVRKSLFHYII
jgi:hypothetical protein